MKVEDLKGRGRKSNGSGSRIGVLQMIDSLRFGGGERVCVELCRRLSRERYRSLLLTYHEGDALAPMLKEHAVRRVAIIRRGWWDVSHVKEVRKLASEEDVRILHTHLYGGNAWGEISRWFTKGLVHVSHFHRMNIAKRSLASLVNRRLVGRSDAVIAVCNSVRDELVQVHGLSERKVVTIYNGVEVERFRPVDLATRAEVRRELDIPSEASVIGIVGSLLPLKHHENLFAATRKLKNRRRIVILVIGTGPAQRRAQLEHVVEYLGIGPFVRFLGPRLDVNRLLGVVDIGVLCSREEAMPLVVLEYMASGVCTVCTDVGGIREMLGEPPAGVIVPKEDSERLAEELESILRDDERRRHLGALARQRAVEYYDIRKTVKQIEQLYEKLLNST